MQLANKDLMFEEDDGRHKATVNIYGRVTTMTRRVVAVFEDVVTVDTTESFRATPPERLFVGTYDLDNSGGGAGGIPNYDIAPNGQRFLMLRPEVESEQDTRQINVVLNWFEEIERLVP